MGSSCSSAQKKKDKDKNASGQSPMDGSRRRSTDSLPYGKGSPPSSRRPSFEPNAASAPVPEQVESPNAQEAPSFTKTPLDAALSQASTIGGGSSSSPPPSGGTMGTPVVKDAPSLEVIGLPDLQSYPDQVRHLLLGRIGELEDVYPTFQEIVLYVAADFHDSAVERDVLAERVFPGLRRYAANKGYDLNVMDMHWGIRGVGIIDHTLRDICVKTVEYWRTRRRLLTLVLFNDNLGQPLLPTSLPKPHFESILESMSSDEDRELFQKWYYLDENASPSSFFLRPIMDDIANDVEDMNKERVEAMRVWKQDSDRMIEILRGVLPDGQKNMYLTSVLEQEIKGVLSDDPQEARRVLWMQRRFTQGKRGSMPSPDTRRVEQTKIQLEDHLPDTQKVVFYVQYHEGKLNSTDVDDDRRYLQEMCDSIKDEITKMIDSLIEEDFVQIARTPYRGIDSPLYNELIQQYKACYELSSNFIGRNEDLKMISDYLQNPDINYPLIVHGPRGCGKTSLISKCVSECSNWLPLAPVVVRLAGLTAESSTHEQLLRSILEQCCALYGEHPAVASESVQDWGTGLEKLLEKVSESRPLVVLIDGLDDEISPYSTREFHWLPKELPTFVKLILTVTDDSDTFNRIKELLTENYFYMQLKSISLSEKINGIEEVLQVSKRRLTESQKSCISTCLTEKLSMRYFQLLKDTILRWPASLETNATEIKRTTEDMLGYLLLHAEKYMGQDLLVCVLGILVASKHGISDSEMVDILSCEDSVLNFVSWDEEFQVRRYPTALWISTKKYLGLFITAHVLGGRTLTHFTSSVYRTAVIHYLNEKGHVLKKSAQILVDYFLGKWSDGKKKPVLNGIEDQSARERFVLDQPLAYGPNPNRRKLDELPYQVLQTGDSIRENFLFNVTWLLYKFCGSDPYHVLEDIFLYKEKISCDDDEELDFFTSVIQLSSYALRCDGSQFFAQMHGRLRNVFSNAALVNKYPSIKAIYDTSCQPPLPSLLSVANCLVEPSLAINSTAINCVNGIGVPFPSHKKYFSGLYAVKDDPAHIISLSCSRGEITVYNIYDQSAVRKLIGINQPKDIKMIDRYRALVLCNRELKVYHLDQGCLLVKLKGVMNQKMPYYGLHDDNYAVALSRNRMYVNMTNLATGDLETTFKVGEDRFLNSLLVSANGRICVCGDETQKPFPLLVWDLGSRKLVYDLRIPHHEFVTKLSAISDDGHYVVSVCRELHETAPNFIIVYDLQSGTLFKKWKPESSSCSIAISSQGGCVVNGLENTWVLVWDLSTGARRYTLRGHSAPVDQIRIDQNGNRCLTYDSRGRDRTLRVWDVTKGECLALFTPDQEFPCCEFSLDGKAVVMGLSGREGITTLLLCERDCEAAIPEHEPYGDEERKHKVYDMSQENQ